MHLPTRHLPQIKEIRIAKSKARTGDYAVFAIRLCAVDGQVRCGRVRALRAMRAMRASERE